MTLPNRRPRPSPSDEQAKVAKDIFSKYSSGAKDNSQDKGGRKKLPATSYIRCVLVATQSNCFIINIDFILCSNCVGK